MHKLIKWLTSGRLLAGACLLAGLQGATASNISVNAGTRAQTITGFGGAVVWAEGTVNNATIENDLFAATNLNVSFLRVRNWYAIYWDGDNTGTIPIEKSFRTYQPKGSVLMTSWSPPCTNGYDLKSNHSTSGSNNGTLLSNDYSGFGSWWLDCLNYYKGQGLTPDYVSMQNEPDYEASWDGCQFAPTNSGPLAYYDAGLNAVWNKFQAHGFPNQKLMAPETGHISNSVSGGEVEHYIDNLDQAHVSAIGFHLYGDNVSVNTTYLTKLQTDFPGWLKLETEYDGDGYFTTNDTGAAAANQIVTNALTMNNVLTCANANAYLVWQLVDCGAGPGCLSSTGSPHNKYYSLAHYSKFINPGDIRIAASSDTPGIYSSAYLDTSVSPNRVVIVVINTTANWDTANLQLTGITENTLDSYVSGYWPSGSTYYNFRLQHYTSPAVLTCPMSVVTIVINQ